MFQITAWGGAGRSIPHRPALDVIHLCYVVHIWQDLPTHYRFCAFGQRYFCHPRVPISFKKCMHVSRYSPAKDHRQHYHIQNQQQQYNQIFLPPVFFWTHKSLPPPEKQRVFPKTHLPSKNSNEHTHTPHYIHVHSPMTCLGGICNLTYQSKK